VFNKPFHFRKCAIYEMWDNAVETDKTQMTKRGSAE